MVFVHVVFTARVFLNLFVGFPGYPAPRVLERPGEKLRVLDQRFDVNVVRVRPRPALHNVQVLGVRRAPIVDKIELGPIEEADGVDDKLAVLIMAYGFAEP